MTEDAKIYKDTNFLFGVGLALVTLIIGIASSVWPELFKPHPYLLTTVGAFGLLLMIGPSVRIAFARRKAEYSSSHNPLEIVFEPLNPARRFWSLEPATSDDGKVLGTYWEHRVEVRNNSSRTLRNVVVTVERTGPLPQLPFGPSFKRTGKEKCDLNPGCSELIPVIFWPYPKRQAGMLASESAWGYGPVKVTISADDTFSVTKTYAFNYETEQMLFDTEVYEPVWRNSPTVIR